MDLALAGVLLLIIVIAFYCYALCEDRKEITYEIEYDFDEDFIPSSLGYYETRTMNYPLLYPDPSVYADYNVNNNYEATMYGASFVETPFAPSPN